jgi:phage host-nuclease inhibitor protein Gam
MPRKPKEPEIPRSEALRKADRMLEEISGVISDMERIRAQAEAEIARATEPFREPIEQLKDRLKGLDKGIRSFAKAQQAPIFEGKDRAYLDHGELIHTVGERVKKAKGVLEALERLGFDEAVIVDKSVDWDELDKWTDERLALVGTERVPIDEFSYETRTED